MGHKDNIYRAIIWTEDGKLGLRVSVVADNLEDAKKQLEAKYGGSNSLGQWIIDIYSLCKNQHAILWRTVLRRRRRQHKIFSRGPIVAKSSGTSACEKILRIVTAVHRTRADGASTARPKMTWLSSGCAIETKP